MGTITKVVMKSGTVFEFEEPMSADYKSGWARYKDSNGNYVLDAVKENIDAELRQEGKVSISKVTGGNNHR